MDATFQGSFKAASARNSALGFSKGSTAMLLSDAAFKAGVFTLAGLHNEQYTQADNNRGRQCESGVGASCAAYLGGEQRFKRAANWAVLGREAASNASIDSSSDLKRCRT